MRGGEVENAASMLASRQRPANAMQRHDCKSDDDYAKLEMHCFSIGRSSPWVPQLEQDTSAQGSESMGGASKSLHNHSSHAFTTGPIFARDGLVIQATGFYELSAKHRSQGARCAVPGTVTADRRRTTRGSSTLQLLEPVEEHKVDIERSLDMKMEHLECVGDSDVVGEVPARCRGASAPSRLNQGYRISSRL